MQTNFTSHAGSPTEKIAMDIDLDCSLLRRWQNMMSRCHDPKDRDFAKYGGRGIRVCERWHNPWQFIKDLEGVDQTLSMDRIDNDKGYCPENVRMVDAQTQQNNRRCNRRLTYNGQTMTVAQWAREIDVPVDALRSRLKHGWPISAALETPMTRGEKFTRTRILKKWPDDKIFDPPVHRDAMIIECGGRKQTLKQWSEETGISRSTIYDRMRRGFTPEKAVSTPALKRGGPPKPGTRRIPYNSKTWTYKGETRTIKDWSGIVDVSYEALLYRYDKGWTAEIALETPAGVSPPRRNAIPKE
jgi:hypothetical protein